QGRRPGVEDEVEGPLAVDLGPDQDVLGHGQPVGHLERPGPGLGRRRLVRPHRGGQGQRRQRGEGPKYTHVELQEGRLPAGRPSGGSSAARPTTPYGGGVWWAS